MIEQRKQFLRSYAYWSCNPEAIPDALSRGFNVVCVVDIDQVGAFPGCIAMSNLLPPPQLMFQMLNSDRSDPNFNEIINHYMVGYQQFLGSSEREEAIVNLLASMYKTTHPILLYTEAETERQFYIIRSIITFFNSVFGIVIGRYEHMYTKDISLMPSFSMRPDHIYSIIELLFTNAYINRKEYACMLPQGSVPSVKSASILLSDYNVAFTNTKEVFIAACNIVDTIKKEVETGMVFPAIRMKEQVDEARAASIKKIIENPETRFGLKGVQVKQLTAMTPQKVNP